MHMFCPAWSIVPRVGVVLVWESYLGLLDSIVRSAERLCDGELCCFGTEGRLVPCVCSLRFNIPTNQKNWPIVGTIASTLAQYSAIYGNTLCQFSWFVGYRVVHPMNEYLNHFVATRSTRASTALRELALVMPRCTTDQFTRSFLPAAAHM